MNDPENSVTPDVAAEVRDKTPEGSGHSESSDWLYHPANIRKIYIGLWVVCLLLVGLDLTYHKHTHFPVEGIFGFFGLYGFVGCVVLVLAAKALRVILMRDEDYYD